MPAIPPLRRAVRRGVRCGVPRGCGVGAAWGAAWAAAWGACERGAPEHVEEGEALLEPEDVDADQAGSAARTGGEQRGVAERERLGVHGRGERELRTHAHARAPPQHLLDRDGATERCESEQAHQRKVPTEPVGAAEPQVAHKSGDDYGLREVGAGVQDVPEADQSEARLEQPYHNTPHRPAVASRLTHTAHPQLAEAVEQKGSAILLW